MLLIRLDASGLGHAKRFGVFASVPVGTAPRCESAGKPCKAGQTTQHTELASNLIRPVSLHFPAKMQPVFKPLHYIEAPR